MIGSGGCVGEANGSSQAMMVTAAALTKPAKPNPGFPRGVDAETVGRYFQVRSADGEALEQMEGADSAYAVEAQRPWPSRDRNLFHRHRHAVS